MKKFISFMILLTGLIAMATVSKADSSISIDQSTVKLQNRQTATATVTQEMGVVQLDEENQTVGGFILKNWGILSLSFLSFLEVVTRLTPSEKDNTVLKFLSNILNAIIPNLRKGGGRL